MNKGPLIGGIILLVGLLALGAFTLLKPGSAATPLAGGTSPPVTASRDLVTLVVQGGGEKKGLMSDPDILNRLEKQFALRIKFVTQGSVELVRSPADGVDVKWPASGSSADMASVKPLSKHDSVNSPIVIYARQPIAEALMQKIALGKETEAQAKAVVERDEGGTLMVDIERLLALVEEKRKWSTVGLPTLDPNTIKVFTTSPGESNSGLSAAGLFATVLNGNEPPSDSSSIAPLAPRVKSIFTRMGRLETSSQALFDLFLAQGFSYPLIVGYENQLIELAVSDPSMVTAIRREQIVVMYPRPTTWATHPILAYSENGKRFLEAMTTDPELLRLAWERHGFRIGLNRESTLPSAVKGLGFAPSISSTVQMPTRDALQELLTALQSR